MGGGVIPALMPDVDGCCCEGGPRIGCLGRRGWKADIRVNPAGQHEAFYAVHWVETVAGRADEAVAGAVRRVGGRDSVFGGVGRDDAGCAALRAECRRAPLYDRFAWLAALA